MKELTLRTDHGGDRKCIAVDSSLKLDIHCQLTSTRTLGREPTVNTTSPETRQRQQMTRPRCQDFPHPTMQGLELEPGAKAASAFSGHHVSTNSESIFRRKKINAAETGLRLHDASLQDIGLFGCRRKTLPRSGDSMSSTTYLRGRPSSLAYHFSDISGRCKRCS